MWHLCVWQAGRWGMSMLHEFQKLSTHMSISWRRRELQQWQIPNRCHNQGRKKRNKQGIIQGLADGRCILVFFKAMISYCSMLWAPVFYFLSWAFPCQVLAQQKKRRGWTLCSSQLWAQRIRSQIYSLFLRGLVINVEDLHHGVNIIKCIKSKFIR